MNIFKFIRKSKTSKYFTAGIVVNFLATLFAPPVYALTSGPSASEYTSFEPVEASDMVNLATGDFTYNLPILEVPGPEGGYPMSLSYHAGILPEAEASWVGLGWTLNPGAINRYVSGFPDDFNKVHGSVWDYWHGGTKTISSAGLSLSIGYYGGSLGFTKVDDTFKGVGVGLSSSFTLGNGEGAGLSFSLSTMPYTGDVVFGIGISQSSSFGSYGNIGASSSMGVGLSVNTASESVMVNPSMGLGVGAKTGIGNVSLAGFSISGNGGSTSIGGFSAQSFQNNANYGRITTRETEKSYGLWFLYGSIGYSERNIRYWSSQGADNTLSGILYYPYGESPNNHSYDTQHLPDIDLTSNISATLENGGMLPAYDSYVVTGQGIGGAIRPQMFENPKLFSQNAEGNNYSVQTKQMKKMQFGFVNDFSSYFRLDENEAVSAANSVSDLLAQIENSEHFDNRAFIQSEKRRVSAKNIEWFTIEEIWGSKSHVAQSKGFIKPNIQEAGREVVFKRSVKDQIGGFSITNASGVTYHYGLPVYSYNKYTKSIKGNDYHAKTEAHPYAYTWLLTAVTGPDYVDRTNDGLSNDDYGYWVEFNYGLWTKHFGWRTPSNKDKYHTDLDTGVKVYTRGEKELYYLDYIRTRSHTAIFEKEIRTDGKGVSDLDKGGHVPKLSSLGPENYTYVSGTQNVYRYPVSPLRLKKIHLIPNEKLDVLLSDNSLSSINGLKSRGNKSTFEQDEIIGQFRYCIGSNCVNTQPFVYTPKDLHIWNNVITGDDLASLKLREISVRSVLFDNDYYELAYDTPNSIANNEVYTDQPNSSPNRRGKLTLKGIQVYGKSGVKLIPPVTFSYNDNPKYTYSSEDKWGYYNRAAIGDGIELDEIPHSTANDAKAWSLTSVSTPYGATIEIDYEADSYMREEFRKFIGKEFVKIVGVEYQFMGYNGYNQIIELDSSVLVKPLHEMYALGDKIAFNAVGRQDNAIGFLKNEVYYDQKATILAFMADNKVLVSAENFGALGSPGYATSPIGGWRDGVIFKEGVVLLDEYHSGFKYGGGLRTKSISMKLTNGDYYQTKYEYINGVTFYSPGEKFPVSSEEINKVLEKEYFKPLLCYAALGMFPGVIYEKVRVREKSEVGGKQTDYPGYVEYAFRTPDLNSDKQQIKQTEFSIGNIPGMTEKYLINRVHTSGIGQLLSVKTFESNGKLLNGLVNTYLEDVSSDLEQYKNDLTHKYQGQGRVDEIFYNQVSRNGIGNLVVNKIEYLPSVLYETHSYDSTVGIGTYSKNLEFDILTGESSKVLTKDATGNYFVNVARNAYGFHPSMGSKAVSGSNYNMLTQKGLTYSFLVDDETALNPIGLVAATASKWTSNFTTNTGYNTALPLHEYAVSYVGIQENLIADGLHGNSNGGYAFSAFQKDEDIYAWALSGDPSWFVSGRVRQVTPSLKPLEYTDVNNQNHAVQYDPYEKRVVASASFSGLGEMAFVGFEHTGKTEAGAVYAHELMDKTFSHTGFGSLIIPEQSDGRFFKKIIKAENRSKTRVYHTSVWVYASSDELSNLENIVFSIGNEAQFVSCNATNAVKTNGWYLLALDFEADPSDGDISIEIKNTGNNRAFHIDDFRVHPVDSDFSSYVYNEWGELEYVLNGDNLYTRYVYDGIGKLTQVWQERHKKSTPQLLTETLYNYTTP